jgi:hypothetical protein
MTVAAIMMAPSAVAPRRNAADAPAQLPARPEIAKEAAPEIPTPAACHETARDCAVPSSGGQSPVTTQPGESSLDHPASWQHLKPLGLVRPPDDLDGPLPEPGKSRLQLLASVPAIVVAREGSDSPLGGRAIKSA